MRSREDRKFFLRLPYLFNYHPVVGIARLLPLALKNFKDRLICKFFAGGFHDPPQSVHPRQHNSSDAILRSNRLLKNTHLLRYAHPSSLPG
jgi:hypothetical protein